jgi:predicted transcriptional regulator of viral defense system
MPAVFETGEAAERLGVSLSRASQILRSLAESGLALRLRHGVWTLHDDIEPFILPPYLTAPAPAYVSFWSALAHHGMIEQVPARIFVASLGRSRRVSTAIGLYSIHHIAPELFEGFTGSAGTGYVATPEKSLFDTVYLRASKGGAIYLPELELPSRFSERKLRRWTGRIAPAQRRSVVARALERALAAASRA